VSEDRPTPGAGALAGAATVFYCLMALMGVAIMAWQEIAIGAAIFGDGTRVLRDTALGAGFGLAIVFATWLARDLDPVRRINDELASLLGRPGSGAIAVLAVSSSVGEEILFRGALQPLIGLWPTALLFGLLHGATQRRLRLWAAFAFVAGVLLGWLTELTGNLLAPILCHLTVNFWNLHAMVARSRPGAP